MKPLTLVLFVLLPMVVRGIDAEPKLEPFTVNPARPEWSTDFAAALVRAEVEKKCVLLDFTGSDWCIWCQRLREEVFEKKPFADYAHDHLVLVELDFPHKKYQSATEMERNEKLAEKYEVTGYPTIVLIDAKGTELGRTGYMEGGAKTFVRELKRLANKTPAAR